jgi:hypothetical protein
MIVLIIILYLIMIGLYSLLNAVFIGLSSQLIAKIEKPKYITSYIVAFLGTTAFFIVLIIIGAIMAGGAQANPMEFLGDIMEVVQELGGFGVFFLFPLILAIINAVTHALFSKLFIKEDLLKSLLSIIIVPIVFFVIIEILIIITNNIIN